MIDFSSYGFPGKCRPLAAAGILAAALGTVAGAAVPSPALSRTRTADGQVLEGPPAAAPQKAEDPAPPAAAPPAAVPAAASKPTSSAKAPVVDDGVLKNSVHGFRFPVPRGWTLAKESTADEMVFTVSSCGDCVLRVLVFPGDNESLASTVKAIKQLASADASSRILGEEPITVAKKEGYTLVKESPLPEAAPSSAPETDIKDVKEAKDVPSRGVLKTRYVTFNNNGDRYYLMLRAPGGRFPSDDSAFETVLKKFRFDS